MTIHKDFPIADILWYKIGGTAQYLLDVDNVEDVKKAIDFIRENKLKRAFFLGSGSNLIFTDDYFDGAVVRFVSPRKGGLQLIGPNVIEAFAGQSIDSVIQFAFENKLVGLEWAGGLPGTVGAAVRGNAGAFGKEIKDIVKEAVVFEITDRKTELETLKRFELKFSYRNSYIKKKRNLIVASVVFKLITADSAGVQRARQEYLNNIEYRKRRHPLEFPNCGSVFKNISDPEDVKKSPGNFS